MSREEARKVFLSRGYIEVEGGTIYDADKWRESCRVISEWLEQEPCEDCISRNKVLEGKVIHQSCDGVEIINSYAVPVEYIKQLPPVIPQPKIGHWIERRSRATGHIESVCSECGAEEGYPYNVYCGNCGARMFEPQERS